MCYSNVMIKKCYSSECYFNFSLVHGLFSTTVLKYNCLQLGCELLMPMILFCGTELTSQINKQL